MKKLTYMASMSYTDANTTCHSTVAPVVFFCAYPDRILVLQKLEIKKNNLKLGDRIFKKNKITNFEKILMGLIEINEFKIRGRLIT